MKTLPKLLDANGRPFPLERELASGGEGSVYTLPSSTDRVAKVYHKPPSPATIEKLTVMSGLANAKLLTIAAWPSSLLKDAKTRKVVGFVMPRLIECEPIQHLYNPVQRLRHFPSAGWKFQVRAAQNLAAAFDEVHRANCLVGDVNQSNAQISTQALVKLIDCDSFQVRTAKKQFLCEVGVAHYTPPELQGKSFRGFVRTENHDRFGLAVLIYQLLFVGRYPYAGIYTGKGEPSFEEMIAGFLFSQGPAAASWGMAPSPHTPTFSDIPPELGMLFRRAFERGSEKGTRPKPDEWIQALQRLEQSINTCAVDDGHEYWSGSQQCTWCRLASNGGPEYYYGVSKETASFVVDEAKLHEVVRRLNACQEQRFEYNPNDFIPKVAPSPKPLPDAITKYRTSNTVLGWIVIVCVLAMPLGLIRGYICLFGFLGALIFASCWLIRILLPFAREYRRRRNAFDRAQTALDLAISDWDVAVNNYHRGYAEQRQEVNRLVSDCRGLGQRYSNEVQLLRNQAETSARVRHLRLFLIADAEITKIGAERKRVLASKGIATAEDVEEKAIQRINGFGAVLTQKLLDWKALVLSQFRFDPSTAVSPADRKKVTISFRVTQDRMLAELFRELAQLEQLGPSCRSKIDKLIPELREAVKDRMQTEVDLRVLRDKR